MHYFTIDKSTSTSFEENGLIAIFFFRFLYVPDSEWFEFTEP